MATIQWSITIQTVKRFRNIVENYDLGEDELLQSFFDFFNTPHSCPGSKDIAVGELVSWLGDDVACKWSVACGFRSEPDWFHKPIINARVLDEKYKGRVRLTVSWA